MFSTIIAVCLITQGSASDPLVKLDLTEEFISVLIGEVAPTVNLGIVHSQDSSTSTIYVSTPGISTVKEIKFVLDSKAMTFQAKPQNKEKGISFKIDMKVIESLKTAKSLSIEVAGKSVKVDRRYMEDVRKFAKLVPDHTKQGALDLLEARKDQLLVDSAKAGEKVAGSDDVKGQATAVREIAEINAEISAIRRKISKLKSK
jgi:hypothetical protein